MNSLRCVVRFAVEGWLTWFLILTMVIGMVLFCVFIPFPPCGM